MDWGENENERGQKWKEIGKKWVRRKKRGKEKKGRKKALKMHFSRYKTQEKNFAGGFAPLHPPKLIPTILRAGK